MTMAERVVFSLLVPWSLTFPDLYYGYVVVIGCIACHWAVVEGTTAWQGVFDQTLVKSLSENETAVSLLWMVAVLISCLLGPLTGHFLDHYGARMTLLAFGELNRPLD